MMNHLTQWVKLNYSVQNPLLWFSPLLKTDEVILNVLSINKFWPIQKLLLYLHFIMFIKINKSKYTKFPIFKWYLVLICLNFILNRFVLSLHLNTIKDLTLTYSQNHTYPFNYEDKPLLIVLLGTKHPSAGTWFRNNDLWHNFLILNFLLPVKTCPNIIYGFKSLNHYIAIKVLISKCWPINKG